MKQDVLDRTEGADQESHDIPGLLSSLASDASCWIRQETQLAKQEIAEKIADVRKNATLLIAGAFTLYAGAVLLLMALAGGVALLLTSNGLTPVQALLAGLAAVGALTTITGFVLCKRSGNQLSPDELKPDKTVESLQESKEWAESKMH